MRPIKHMNLTPSPVPLAPNSTGSQRAFHDVCVSPVAWHVTYSWYFTSQSRHTWHIYTMHHNAHTSPMAPTTYPSHPTSHIIAQYTTIRSYIMRHTCILLLLLSHVTSHTYTTHRITHTTLMDTTLPCHISITSYITPHTSLRSTQLSHHTSRVTCL